MMTHKEILEVLKLDCLLLLLENSMEVEKKC